jgi:hypothetical protein
MNVLTIWTTGRGRRTICEDTFDDYDQSHEVFVDHRPTWLGCRRMAGLEDGKAV